MPQRTVVHVHRALEDHLFRIYAERIALVYAVVDHGAEQIIGRGHGVNIAGEVQVDVLHGQHLGVSAAGGAAFDAEHRTEGGFAQGDDRPFPDLGHRVAEAHGRRCLALAGRRGTDGGHEHELAVRAVLQGFVYSGLHFCLIVAVQLKSILVNIQFFCDIDDLLHFCVLCDLYIRQHAEPPIIFAEFTCSGHMRAKHAHDKITAAQQRACNQIIYSSIPKCKCLFKVDIRIFAVYNKI